MQPFLSVITRCYKRPNMLQRNKDSLDRQTCQDWHQVFIVDDIGRGVGWANAQFYTYREEAVGKYVLMLDDDDELISDSAVEILKKASRFDPAIIVFKGEHGVFGVLPTDEVWEKVPKVRNISGQDFVVRTDLWKKHIHRFDASIEGDIQFLDSLFRDLEGESVVWLDELLVRQQWNGQGRAEIMEKQ